MKNLILHGKGKYVALLSVLIAAYVEIILTCNPIVQEAIRFNSVLLVIVGLLICIVPVFFISQKNGGTACITLGQDRKPFWLLIIFSGISIPFLAWLCIGFFTGAIVSMQHGDVLPTIQHMATLAAHGEWNSVYTEPLSAPTGEIVGTYMPLLFLPYSLVLKMGGNVFVVNAIAVCAALFMCIFVFDFIMKKGQLILFILIGASLLLFANYLFSTSILSLASKQSAEVLVCSYYVLLAVSLFKRWWMLAGLALLCCVLSRYIVLGFAAALLLHLLITKQWKPIVKMLSFSLPILITLITLPFGKNWMNLFVELPKIYVPYTQEKWQFDIAAFHCNFGLAKFFGAEYYLLQHNIVSYGLLCLPIALFLLLRKFANDNLFWLLLLKVCYVFFLALVDIPFQHLFLPSVFLTILVVFVALQRAFAMQAFFLPKQI